MELHIQGDGMGITLRVRISWTSLRAFCKALIASLAILGTLQLALQSIPI
jgi:hypothetical protein